MASGPLTFPKFSLLPVEVRLMVWDLSTERRFVSLAEKQHPRWWSQGPRSPIQQTRPVLLVICHESRGVELLKYGSVFTQNDEGWKWEGSKKSKDLRTVLLALGLPRGGSSYNMTDRILRHLNNPAEWNTTSSKFASCGVFGLSPIWFDVFQEILLINSNIYENDYTNVGLAFTAALWDLWNSYASTKLGHVAFNLQNHTAGPLPPPPPGMASSLLPVPWLRRLLSPFHPQELPVRNDFYSEVQSVTLLPRDACEVILITLDESGLLQPGEWSYSLDTQTQLFKEAFGVHWSQVTWNVCLAKIRDHTLWEIAEAWRPAMQVWKDLQKQLCEGNNEVEGMWKTVNRRSGRRFGGVAAAATPELQLVVNGDGKTYMGP